MRSEIGEWRGSWKGVGEFRSMEEGRVAVSLDQTAGPVLTENTGIRETARANRCRAIASSEGLDEVDGAGRNWLNEGVGRITQR